MLFNILGVGVFPFGNREPSAHEEYFLLFMFPEVYGLENAMKTRTMHEDDGTIIIFPMTLIAEHY